MKFPFNTEAVATKLGITVQDLADLRLHLKEGKDWRKVGKWLGYSESGVESLTSLLLVKKGGEVAATNAVSCIGQSPRIDLNEPDHVEVAKVVIDALNRDVPKESSIETVPVLAYCPNKAFLWAKIAGKKTAVFVKHGAAGVRLGSKIKVVAGKNGVYELAR